MRKPYSKSLLWLTQLPVAILGKPTEVLFISDNETLPYKGTPESNSSSNSLVPNCIPPSISEFPDDHFTNEQRLHGGIIVHALVVAYVCAMMAIVCERYFVPSLRVISKHFNVPPDVAGATFMAVGTSSPELFSSVIGAFVAKGDIGVGTIVGSAVFNILGVTGVSAIALGSAAAHLDWYPITRDCFVYVITVATLVFIIHDNLVTWFEASCLLTMFACYVILLYFNDGVRRAVIKKLKAIKSWWCGDHHYLLHNIKNTSANEKTPLTIKIDKGCKSVYNSYDNNSECPSASSENSSFLFTSSSSSDRSEMDNHCTIERKNSAKFSAKGASYQYEEFTESVSVSLLTPPEGVRRKITWFLMWPANALFRITVPNCSSEGNLKWFPLTFVTSICWLGILSYISFWMVATIGYTFGIPDTVSGITILAAGTSVPELAASVIVVKSGMANMALSNLIGSNIFDILFCLGLPWLVKALLNTETYSLVINSSALKYTTLILLTVVMLFYLTLLLCKWKMGLRVGLIALGLYAIFLVLASLYESNVFGDFNPPIC